RDCFYVKQFLRDEPPTLQRIALRVDLKSTSNSNQYHW
uniref:Uncharacterized protein n=2 Tax=Parascaris univalens TaxID=6257 RepID=A0A915BMS9_PARUN